MEFTPQFIKKSIFSIQGLITNFVHPYFLCSDQSQLKQLHNQVLLEQQQVHQASLRELSFSSTLVNSVTSFYQQSSSTLYKQSSASASPAFGYSRPKQLLAAQTPPASPSASSSAAFSSAPQASQRTNNMENFIGNPPPSQSRSSGGFASKSEQSLASPKEPVVPPLTLSTSSVKQFQAQTVTPAPLSPTGRIQNPVAFLSAVLPSLPAAPSTNAMGLPRSTPATWVPATTRTGTLNTQRNLPCVSVQVFSGAVTEMQVFHKIEKWVIHIFWSFNLTFTSSKEKKG